MVEVTKIHAYKVDLLFKKGEYTCRNITATKLESTIIRLDTDTGHSGYGEVAPLGAFYSEAFTAGARAAIDILAPVILGCDPREPLKCAYGMDAVMMGQGYAKTPFDFALWDLAAQSADLPLAEFLGGRFGETTPLYGVVMQQDFSAMFEDAAKQVASGRTILQIKVGKNHKEEARLLYDLRSKFDSNITLICDANGAWTSMQAIEFINATKNLEYSLEQPCRTYKECLMVRQHCNKPFILDESVDSIQALLNIYADGAADSVTIKISRFGGLT